MAQNSVQSANEISMKRARKDWPFYWISRVNARYVQVLEAQLKPIGLDMPRWRVLMSLHEDEHLSVSQIAEYSVLRLNTATKIIQRMQQDGLVLTRQCQTDGRATEVSLTPKGEMAREAALFKADQILESAFLKITQEETRALNSLLETVLNRLSAI